MENNNELNVYFWRDVPIDVDIKLYNDLASIWQGKIFEISFNGLSKEREECGYINKDNKYYTYYYKELPQEKIQDILNETTAIHVFSGFKGYKGQYINYLKNKKKNIAVLLERPNYTGGGVQVS